MSSSLKVAICSKYPVMHKQVGTPSSLGMTIEESAEIALSTRSLSVPSQRMLMGIISRISSEFNHLNIDALMKRFEKSSSRDFYEIVLTQDDFYEMGIARNQLARDLMKANRELSNFNIDIRNDEKVPGGKGLDGKSTGWYNLGGGGWTLADDLSELSIKLPMPLVKLFVRLPPYTEYELRNISTLQKRYSIPIYNICRSVLHRGRASGVAKVDINVLRRALSIDSHGETYLGFSEIRRSILKPAIDEINADACTDINVTFTTHKVSRRVVAVSFKVTRKKNQIPLLDLKDSSSVIPENVNRALMKMGFAPYGESQKFITDILVSDGEKILLSAIDEAMKKFEKSKMEKDYWAGWFKNNYADLRERERAKSISEAARARRAAKAQAAKAQDDCDKKEKASYDNYLEGEIKRWRQENDLKQLSLPFDDIANSSLSRERIENTQILALLRDEKKILSLEDWSN